MFLIIPRQILHSTGLEFQHQVQDAKDLDQLIKIHYRYLSTIHDRCLLREKVGLWLWGSWHGQGGYGPSLARSSRVILYLQVSFVKEAIMKVLNLVHIFSDRWQAGFGAWK